MNMYSVGMAVSVLMCAAAMIVLLSRAGLGTGRACFVSAVSAVCGLLTARLVFWLGALDFFMGRAHSLLSYFWWTDGGFSLFGAIVGAVGGAWLCLKTMNEHPLLMDALSLPLLLLVAEARLLEWTTMGMDFGPAMDFPAWLTVSGEYGSRMNVALVEAVLIVCAAAYLALGLKRDGRSHIRLRDTLFLIGLIETLMISMRRDSYMMWGFVHQEQLYFYVLSAAALYMKGRECGKAGQAIIAALLGAGWIVFLEFALDGRVLVPFAFLRDWADPFWYCLFVLTLVGLVVFYEALNRRNERKEAA